MIIRDTNTGYGLVTRLFHWLMAIAIVAIFGPSKDLIAARKSGKIAEGAVEADQW